MHPIIYQLKFSGDDLSVKMMKRLEPKALFNLQSQHSLYLFINHVNPNPNHWTSAVCIGYFFNQGKLT